MNCPYDELFDVYVGSDGVNLLAEDFNPKEGDDSYRKCKTAICIGCEEMLDISYDEPIATCECGSQEWYL